MACFGSYDVNNFMCRGCRVINSCRRATYDNMILKRKNDAEKSMNNRFKRILLALLRCFREPVTTNSLYKAAKIRNNYGASYHRTKKLLLELKNKGLVRLRRKNDNGYYWEVIR